MNRFAILIFCGLIIGCTEQKIESYKVTYIFEGKEYTQKVLSTYEPSIYYSIDGARIYSGHSRVLMLPPNTLIISVERE